MKYRIEGVYTPEADFEISVAVGSHSFLVIYGTHLNGAFCCIPTMGISCEMNEPADTFFNRTALLNCGLTVACAREIAAAIRDMAAAMKVSLRDAANAGGDCHTSVRAGSQ